MIHKIDVIHNDILIIPDYDAHEKIKQMVYFFYIKDLIRNINHI
jgi:hypothetical protein